MPIRLKRNELNFALGNLFLEHEERGKEAKRREKKKEEKKEREEKETLFKPVG